MDLVENKLFHHLRLSCSCDCNACDTAKFPVLKMWHMDVKPSSKGRVNLSPFTRVHARHWVWSWRFSTHFSNLKKWHLTAFHTTGSRDGWLVGYSAGLVIERLRVQSPAGTGEVSSPVNFVCWLLFGVCSTPVLPQRHVKDPGHSAKSAGGRLHLYMHTSLTQWSRHSVGTYRETSSHVTRQGTLDHSHLSSLSHCGLILA